MPYSGYTTFAYKELYKKKYDKPNNSEFDSTINFIKDIYSIKKHTGNINYFKCDCINFPNK